MIDYILCNSQPKHNTQTSTPYTNPTMIRSLLRPSVRTPFTSVRSPFIRTLSLSFHPPSVRYQRLSTSFSKTLLSRSSSLPPFPRPPALRLALRHVSGSTGPPSNRPEEPPKKKSSKLMTLATVGGALAFSGKKALVALKFTKALPLLSMIGTSLTYSLFFGPAYGVGMVGLIACHEAGHAAMLVKYGRDFNPMVMIPFMGAVIVTKDKVSFKIITSSPIPIHKSRIRSLPPKTPANPSSPPSLPSLAFEHKGGRRRRRSRPDNREPGGRRFGPLWLNRRLPALHSSRGFRLHDQPLQPPPYRLDGRGEDSGGDTPRNPR